MSEKPCPSPDDLLSAFFDEETSPEERVQAERLLEYSPAARGELNEIARLSDLLRSLPRESAPVELAPAVLRRAERETLLSAATAPAASHAKRRRGWGVVISGLVASAAAVLITVQIITPSNREAEWNKANRSHSATDQRDVGHARHSQDAEIAQSLLNESDPDAPGPPADLGIDGMPLARRNAARAELSAAAPQGEAERASALASATHAQQRRFLEKSDAALQSLVLNGIDPYNVEIGKVIPYLEGGEGRVAVIEFTVVDVEQAVGAMQVLLARNAIPPVATEEAESPPDDDARRKRIEGRSRDGQELLAVYVETTGPQLASALNEVRQAELFLDLKLQPPVALDDVEVASLDADAKGQSEGRFGRPERDKLAARETLQDAARRGRLQQGEQLRPQEAAGQRIVGMGAGRAAVADRQSAPAEQAPVPSEARPPAAPAPAAASEPTDGTVKREKPRAVAERTATADAPTGLAARNVESFQLLLNVPSESLRSRHRMLPGQEADGQPTAQPFQAPSPDGRAAAALRNADRADESAAAPLRVLFVFQTSPRPLPR